ncbi:MAG TPA: putative Ig domain-containing protein, partial [Blastocatellia bacterium]|nr:putative Ig domain-containing protein [Blastocatellia bacterium]
NTNFTMTSSCPAITVTPATVASGTVNNAYNQSFGATGGTSPYTFSLSAGSLPNGLTLSPAGGLSGTPTQAGNFNITIMATDANLCVGTRAYTLTINCQPITLAPAGLPTGTVGGNYSQTITASGGTPPHTFSVTSGSLPAGLSLSSSGVLSGIPTTPGTSNFTVTPTDASNCAGSQGYSLTIDSPTIVSLISFTATTFDKGTLFEWRTGFEVDNLGFNIYRDDETQGTKSLINQHLIAGSAFLVGSAALGSGGSYQWWDKGIANCGLRIADCQNALYWLEDIDINGQSKWHGPFVAVPSTAKQHSASVQQAKTLAALSPTEAPSVRLESQAALLPAGAASSAAQSQMQSAIISSPNTLKLPIKHEGWHRVTQQELTAAGLSSSIDPRNLQLFVDGRQQAISVTGQEDGRLDPSDAVEFYGTGIDSTFSDLRTYYLVSGKRAGLRISTTRSPAHPSLQGSFDYTVERRDRTIYFSALRNGDKENFFGAVVAGQPVDQTLTLHHLAPAALPASLSVVLQGVTNVSHRVTILFNGIDVGELVFQSQSEGHASISISPALLREGANQVTLVAQGGPSDVSLLDYVRVTYRHSFTADDDLLKLEARAGEQLTIDGFNNNAIRVLDVTDPYAVQEITGHLSKQESGFSISLVVPGTGQRSLLATTTDRAAHVARVVTDYASNLRGARLGADLLIITRRELFDSVQELKEFRNKQGLSVAVVDIEDIYDEFSFGQKSPHAVKDFIGFALTVWKKPVKYVLFFGDASLDP